MPKRGTTFRPREIDNLLDWERHHRTYEALKQKFTAIILKTGLTGNIEVNSDKLNVVGYRLT